MLIKDKERINHMLGTCLEMQDALNALTSECKQEFIASNYMMEKLDRLIWNANHLVACLEDAEEEAER